jgi:hypothetical protein
MRTSSHILWLVLAVGACGKVSALSDASGTGTDANLVDADAHGVAKVTAFDFATGTVGVANLPTVFINPDGQVASDTKTDASGKAQATILPGASVHVVYPPDPNSNNFYLTVSVLDIKPGDDIVVPQVGHDSTDAGTFMATATGATGATHYTLYGPCGPTDASNQMHFQNWCKTDTFDVYAIAYDGNNNAIDYAIKTGVAFNNGSTNITGPWQNMQTFSAHYSDISADVTSISLDRFAGGSQGYDVYASGAPVAGALTLTPSAPAPGATSAVVDTTFSRSDGAQQSLVQQISGSSFSYSDDVTANLLPWFGKPTVDLAAGTIAPNTTGSTATLDEYIAVLQWNHPTADAGNQEYAWIAFGPSAATFTFPTLPADAGDVSPKAGDSAFAAESYGLDRTDANGWDDVRNHAWEELIDILGGGTGTGRVTEAPFGGGK